MGWDGMGKEGAGMGGRVDDKILETKMAENDLSYLVMTTMEIPHRRQVHG